MYQLYHTKQNVFWNLDTHNHLSPNIFKQYVNNSNNWTLVPNISLRYESTFTAKIVVPIDLETNYFKQVFANKTTYWYVVLAENYTTKTKTLVLEMDIYATYIIDLISNWSPNKKVFMDRAHKKVNPGWFLNPTDKFTLTDDDLILSVANTNPQYKFIAKSDVNPTNFNFFYVKSNKQNTWYYPNTQFFQSTLYICVSPTGKGYFELFPVWEYGHASPNGVVYPGYLTQGELCGFNVEIEGRSDLPGVQVSKILITGEINIVLKAITDTGRIGKVIGFFWGPDIRELYSLTGSKAFLVPTSELAFDKQYYDEPNLSCSDTPPASFTTFTQKCSAMYFKIPTGIGYSIANHYRKPFYLTNPNSLALKLTPNATNERHNYFLYNYLSTYIGCTEVNLCNLGFWFILSDINFVNGFTLSFTNCSQPILLSTTYPINVDKVKTYYESIRNQYNVGTNKLIADGVVEIARSAVKGAAGGFLAGDKKGGIIGGVLGGALSTTQFGIDVGFRERELQAKLDDMYASTPYQPPQVELKDLTILENSKTNRSATGPTLKSITLVSFCLQPIPGRPDKWHYKYLPYDCVFTYNHMGFPITVKTYDDKTIQTMENIMRWYGLKIGQWITLREIDWWTPNSDGTYANPCCFVKFNRTKLKTNLDYYGPSEIRSKILDVLSNGLRLWNQLSIDENFSLDLTDNVRDIP